MDAIVVQETLRCFSRVRRLILLRGPETDPVEPDRLEYAVCEVRAELLQARNSPVELH